MPGIDKSSLERLVPDELLKDEATGLRTLKLHIERYEFAARTLRDTASILDLACGVGYGSRLMKDSIPAATVTGVDACAAAIEYAAVHYSKPGLSFRVGHALDFDDGPFDGVVSLETIEHLPYPQAFMERVTKRLLRPGGLFIGSVPVTPSMDANPHHLHDFTARSFRRLLASHDFVELDSLYQVQTYSPLAVITKTEERMQAMRPNIWAYYYRNPQKALLRLGSILTDGFKNKYLTIAALQQPPSQQISDQPASNQESGPGLRVFEGACIGCHQFDGKGAVSNYASLVVGRTANDPAGTNATQALIGGTHLGFVKTAGFMPNFGNGYSDPEIAAVINYVTGRFGARASALSPQEVAKQRQAD